MDRLHDGKVRCSQRSFEDKECAERYEAEANGVIQCRWLLQVQRGERGEYGKRVMTSCIVLSCATP